MPDFHDMLRYHFTCNRHPKSKITVPAVSSTLHGEEVAPQRFSFPKAKMFAFTNEPDEKRKNHLLFLSDEELLDRWSFFSEGLTADGLRACEEELDRRNLTAAHRAEFTDIWSDRLWRDTQGHARTCHACQRVATQRNWVFRRLFKLIPVLPMRLLACDQHGRQSR